MCHALIIEDEPFIALHIADLVEGAGARSVELAGSESGAIRAASHRRPDIILCDVNLLEGNGPAAVRTIRDRHGLIPVIFVTANPEGLPASYPQSAVIAKPFASEQLIIAFNRFISSDGARDNLGS